jgi:hypothetical protein
MKPRHAVFVENVNSETGWEGVRVVMQTNIWHNMVTVKSDQVGDVAVFECKLICTLMYEPCKNFHHTYLGDIVILAIVISQ